MLLALKWQMAETTRKPARETELGRSLCEVDEQTISSKLASLGVT